MRRPTGAALALLIVPGVAHAQRGVESSAPELSLPLQFGVNFLFTLVVAGLLIGVAPDYVDRIIDRIHQEPGASVLWGVGVLALFVGLAVLLAITVIGIVVLVPMVIAMVILGAVGTTIAYIAVVDGLVTSRSVAVVAAAVVSAVLSVIPILGGIVGFVVSSAGVGAVAMDYRD